MEERKRKAAERRRGAGKKAWLAGRMRHLQKHGGPGVGWAARGGGSRARIGVRGGQAAPEGAAQVRRGWVASARRGRGLAQEAGCWPPPAAGCSRGAAKAFPLLKLAPNGWAEAGGTAQLGRPATGEKTQARGHLSCSQSSTPEEAAGSCSSACGHRCSGCRQQERGGPTAGLDPPHPTRVT